MTVGSYKLFIDESGSPHFDASLPENEGYCSCVVAIPEDELENARSQVPRDSDGSLIKSSHSNATDELGRNFIREIFNSTGAFAGVSVGARGNERNAQLFKKIEQGIDPNLKKRYKTKPGEIMRWYAAMTCLKALCEFPAYLRQMRRFSIVFDRGSESPALVEGMRQQMLEMKGTYSIPDLRFMSTADEPLLLIPDWIAGTTLRDVKRSDQPLTRETLRGLVENGRIAIREKIEVRVPTSDL